MVTLAPDVTSRRLKSGGLPVRLRSRVDEYPWRVRSVPMEVRALVSTYVQPGASRSVSPLVAPLMSVASVLALHGTDTAFHAGAAGAAGAACAAETAGAAGAA
jgi:hypothetical protein